MSASPKIQLYEPDPTNLFHWSVRMTPSMFTPQEQGMRPATEHWLYARDGDEAVRAVFDRHYSRKWYADCRRPKLFCGPGEKTVLFSHAGDAIFIWRKFISDDGQTGVNCAVFRNESSIISSTLIQEAETVAAIRWPCERLFTYVNPREVRSVNPGFCFKMAGWKKCGITKHNRLIILEKFPS